MFFPRRTSLGGTGSRPSNSSTPGIRPGIPHDSRLPPTWSWCVWVTSAPVIRMSSAAAVSTIEPTGMPRVTSTGSYFLAPEGKTSGPEFAVFRDSLEGRATVGRLALHGREYLVAVLARGQALVMYTLRTADELRDTDAIEELNFASAKTKPDEIRLARQILKHFEDGTDLKTLTDPRFYTRPVAAQRKWMAVANGHILPYDCAEEGWRQRLEQLEQAASGKR